MDPESYSKSSQTSNLKLFCEKKERLSVVNYFHKSSVLVRSGCASGHLFYIYFFFLKHDHGRAKNHLLPAQEKSKRKRKRGT